MSVIYPLRALLSGIRALQELETPGVELSRQNNIIHTTEDRIHREEARILAPSLPQESCHLPAP